MHSKAISQKSRGRPVIRNKREAAKRLAWQVATRFSRRPCTSLCAAGLAAILYRAGSGLPWQIAGLPAFAESDHWAAKAFFTRRFVISICALFLVGSITAAAEKTLAAPVAEAAYDKPAALHPFSILGRNISDSFWGKTTYFHLGAFATTAVMVKTQADRKIQDYFISENPLGHDFGFAMLRLGDATSIVLSLAFWGFGSWKDIPTLAASGAAGTQAVLLNGAFVGSLKVITARYRPGRTNSDDDFFPSFDERIDNFRFRQSYPSGHTSSSFAFVASQHAFFPKEKWIPWVCYPIAGAIGIGMVEGDYHWASEVIAGAIIGTTIGYTVGRNFREEYERRKAGIKDDARSVGNKAPAFTLSPTVANGRYAMSITWYW